MSDITKREVLESIAIGGVERNATLTGADDADSTYDEIFTCAFDALVDRRVDHALARDIAESVAQRYAQP